jgi:hypothetical protein
MVKFNKKKVKENLIKNECICGICNRIIFRNVDDYVHMEDYYKGKFYMDGYYHTTCYNNKIKGQQDKEMSDMKKKAINLMNAAGKMLGMKEEEPMEVVHI